MALNNLLSLRIDVANKVRTDSARKSETNWAIERAFFAAALIVRDGLDRTLVLGPDVTLQDLAIDPSDGRDLVRIGAPRGVRRLELKGSMTREFGNARPTWVS